MRNVLPALLHPIWPQSLSQQQPRLRSTRSRVISSTRARARGMPPQREPEPEPAPQLRAAELLVDSPHPVDEAFEVERARARGIALRPVPPREHPQDKLPTTRQNTHQIAFSVLRSSFERTHMRRTVSPASSSAPSLPTPSSCCVPFSLSCGPGLVSRSTESPRQPAALRARTPGGGDTTSFRTAFCAYRFRAKRASYRLRAAGGAGGARVSWGGIAGEGSGLGTGPEPGLGLSVAREELVGARCEFELEEEGEVLRLRTEARSEKVTDVDVPEADEPVDAREEGARGGGGGGFAVAERGGGGGFAGADGGRGEAPSDLVWTPGLTEGGRWGSFGGSEGGRRGSSGVNEETERCSKDSAILTVSEGDGAM